jgi:hypothetical protein
MNKIKKLVKNPLVAAAIGLLVGATYRGHLPAALRNLLGKIPGSA